MPASNLTALLLGPIDLRLGNASLSLGGPKQRSILAMMCLAEGRTVSVDRLVDGLWGSAPPNTAGNNIQVHVAALRKIFKQAGHPEALVTQAPGYRLDPLSCSTDIAQFKKLRQAADQKAADGNELAEASSLYDSALSLWRGEALADLVTEPFAQPEATALTEARLDTIDAFLATELRQNRQQDVVRVTQDLLREYPTRERLWEHQMLALYRNGRQGEALEAFRRAREILADQLGVDPGPALKELHEKILRQDPGLAAARPREPRRGTPNLSVCTSTVVRQAPRAARARLVTSFGDVVLLEGSELTIGRQSTCGLRLSDPDVSRTHAKIRRSAAGHVVEDLGSTNGSMVNGVVVSEAVLRNGDCIEMGSTVLRYEVLDQPGD